MKYTGFIFLAILFFLSSLGINLYFYYEELLEKSKEEIEGFAISQSGIMLDNSGELFKCKNVGEQTSYTYIPSSGFGNLTNVTGKCRDISYVDQNGIMKSGARVYIYPNYYVDPATGALQPVPYGYVANSQQTGYYANSTAALIETSNNQFTPPPISQDIDSTTTYSQLNNVQYNKGYKPADDSNGLPPGKMYFPNGDGTVSIVDIDLYDQNTFYHETSTYDAGPRNFIPNYENTGYMSSLGSQNIQDLKNKDPIYLAGAPLSNTRSSYLDINTLYKTDPASKEAACNAMNPSICASSSSCALLGGQKCVSADENGPIMKSNYSDFMIMNRDYYYYKGQCYGLCPST